MAQTKIKPAQIDIAKIKSIGVMGGHGNGAQVAALTTAYIVPMIAGLDTVGRSFPWPVGGILKNLYVRLAGGQPATGALVFNLYDVTAGISTGITITVPAGGAAGTYSNTSNTYTHTAGNLLQLAITNAASSLSASIGGCSWTIESALV